MGGFDFSTLLPLSKPAALIALAVAILGVVIASSAGYLLSRRGKEEVARSVTVLILPALLLLAPLVFVLFWLGQLHAWLLISAFYLVALAPFCSWQLKRAYDALPHEVEEAAVIDGCNRGQLFRLVVLPAILPALIFTALFSFFVACYAYLFFTIEWPRRVDFWAMSSGLIFLAALLIGFCIFLFGRSAVSDGTAEP